MASDDSEFIGKYENSGAIGRILVERFFSAAAGLIKPHLNGSERILEAGCGAGYSTARIARWSKSSALIASDLSYSLLLRACHQNPGVKFVQESVYHLAHGDQSFDYVIMLEVLEHLDHPRVALKELQRVAKHGVLLSTPREPLWRLLNFARGKYFRDLGNTPGHVQHWSTRGLTREVSPYFRVEAIATPVPWTMLWLRPR